VTVAVTEFLKPAGRQEIDPEPLRQIGERCATAAARVYEQHGGVVEPLLGPNLVAVFGSPVLHEDDALRALRAASSLDGALSALSDELERDYGVRISVRTGVATGEVITGAPALGRPPIVGEPMTLAGQLLQKAGPGQILLAESTRRMVESVVRVADHGGPRATRAEPGGDRDARSSLADWHPRSAGSRDRDARR
jgi:class 3 adenylate cyclase